jgi:uncharacterized damage-inducible protein DinB
VASDDEPDLPSGTDDERELLLGWLSFLRGALLRNLEGLDDEQAHWTPEGQLLPIIGIVNHVTNVEWRWIDGGFLGATVSRHESEFRPARTLSAEAARDRYRERAARTDATVRSLPLDTAHADQDGRDLRWVLLHLINETARHCGHADATRELLDGTTGE